MIEVLMQPVFNRDQWKIAIKGGAESRQYYNFIKQGFVHKEVGEPLNEECLLSLDSEVWKALGKAFKENKDIPDPEKSFAEGKLVATEKHLEDMRKLVLEEKY